MGFGCCETCVNGHYQHIAEVFDTGSAQVSLRKSVYCVVAVVIAATSVPTFEACVGTWLNHTEWHYGTWIGVSVAVGAYERVDQRGKAFVSAA